MIPIKSSKKPIDGKESYNNGLDTAANIVEEVIGGTSEGETILCGIESSKKIQSQIDSVFFLEEEIVAEFSNGEEVRPLICDPENYPEDSIGYQEIQDQIDSENNYCETCDSCGETGCCPPINCHAVKCKYGEINIKDYRCFQDQWSVMYEALKDIVAEYSDELDGRIAKNALKAVDKLWDKLYNKE